MPRTDDRETDAGLRRKAEFTVTATERVTDNLSLARHAAKVGNFSAGIAAAREALAWLIILDKDNPPMYTEM